MPKIAGTEVGQLMLLQLGPDVLGGIQLRSVSRKIEGGDLPAQGGEVILDQTAAVCGQAVPNEQDGLANLCVEVADEVEHFLFAHRSFVKAEVELPESDSGGDGKVVPVELVLQDRRDTAP